MPTALWEFPAADFDDWQTLVGDPIHFTVAEYMTMLARCRPTWNAKVKRLSACGSRSLKCERNWPQRAGTTRRQIGPLSLLSGRACDRATREGTSGGTIVKAVAALQTIIE